MCCDSAPTEILILSIVQVWSWLACIIMHTKTSSTIVCEDYWTQFNGQHNMRNLPHQRNLSFPSKPLRPNASQTWMLLQSLAAQKTGNIIKSKKRSRSSIVGPKKTSNCKELAHQAEKTKSCKSDLRPHRASVCPHMFVCPSSSRIWSTCGFWAGRVGLIFGQFFLPILTFAWSLCWNCATFDKF